jgi:hypothetical protein
MKMQGISLVRNITVDPDTVKGMGRKEQQAVGCGLVMLPFHQIIHVSLQKVIYFIKVMTVQGILFRYFPGYGIAEGYFLCMDACIRIHRYPPLLFPDN